MDDDHARRLLAQHREQLEGELARLRHDGDDDEHLADDELEAGLAAQVREELEAIERAERRNWPAGPTDGRSRAVIRSRTAASS